MSPFAKRWFRTVFGIYIASAFVGILIAAVTIILISEPACAQNLQGAQWKAYHVANCKKGCSAAFAVMVPPAGGRPYPPVHLLQIGKGNMQTLVPTVDYQLAPVQSGPDLVIQFKIPILPEDRIFLVFSIGVTSP